MLDSEVRNVTYKAERGDKTAQYELGLYYSKKQGYEHYAKSYLEKAAKQQHPEASYEYAKLLLGGNSNSNMVDVAKYFFIAGKNGIDEAKQQFRQQGALYKKAVSLLGSYGSYGGYCSDKDQFAVLFAKAYMDNHFGCQSDEQACWFLDAAISQNSRNGDAVALLADSYYLPTLGRQQDLPKAYKLLKDLTSYYRNNGNAHIYHRLGEMLENGKGTEKSLDDAIGYYKKAVEMQHTGAAYRLGVIYYSKYSECRKTSDWQTSSMKCEAIKFLEKCGENRNAYNYLGLIYHLAGEKSQAERYFTAAAKLDLPVAARNLGQIYSTGNYGETKKKSAVTWYEKAALLGYAESQYVLSTMLEKGENIEKNIPKAFEWCLKAAELKYDKAIESLKTHPIFAPCYRLYGLLDGDLEKVQRYHKLEQQLGHEFADAKHLLNALDRRKSSPTKEAPFQRYEFLGDSVLGVACAASLSKDQPDNWLVYDLHLAKEKLVRNDTVLPRIAKTLNLSDVIMLDDSESNHPVTAKMLADAMEALIGAVSFDKGILAATQVAQTLWTADVSIALKAQPSKPPVVVPAVKAKPNQPPVAKKVKAKSSQPAAVPAAVLPSAGVPKQQRRLSNGAIQFFSALPNLSSDKLSAKLDKRPDYAMLQNEGKKGYTPLMYKVERLGKRPKQKQELVACIKTLIQHGAQLQDKGGNGKSAAQLLEGSSVDQETKQSITRLSYRR